MTISLFLADDHGIVRDGLKFLLSRELDFEVVGDADNGRETIERVTEQRPDVVIMDIAMPSLNGIETTRHIAETLPDTKIIILSMHATSEHIYHALQAGARGYLLKESVGNEVVEAIRTVQAGHYYLSQKISNTVIGDYVVQRTTGPVRSPMEKLTSREIEILQMVVEGNSSAEIAKTLHLSPKTVDSYRSRIMQKLELNDLPSLVKFAIQNGITPLA